MSADTASARLSARRLKDKIMNIRVIGAAGGEVTGSAYIVQTKNARILIDCGLFQGSRQSEQLNRPPTFPNTKLDAVLVTHGHLDHTGRLPMLARLGYHGPIYATPVTIEMTALILRDAARIQIQDNERENRKRARQGKEPIVPLYSAEDVESILAQMHPVPYQEPVPVAPGIRAMWKESGHMLGSASIQLIVDEDGIEKRVVFSGDLGPKSVPILRDFEPFHRADIVFLESTYGDRDHRPFRETAQEFVDVVKDSAERGGKILVPAFAVGRAQLLGVLLAHMFRSKMVKPFSLYLDSPMAIEATEVYRHHHELFDDQMLDYIEERSIWEDLTTLQMTATADESRAINSQTGACLIMAGAGMCNAGRILHHLRNNLYKPETHVLIVGYQGDGSLGRQLVQGAKEVRIFGEKIAVRAQVHTLNGFSAHAGQSDLLNWFDAIAPSRPRVVLTHGEDGPRTALSEKIQIRYGAQAVLPQMQEVIEL